ncbi:acyl-CoA thioesterase domain-containing protein [Aeromicrobium sp.]|uniref:acyl-CoA thioesterase n=1 Tax=Aeromicrobium sp. TaxID=1871063 RepID=UPI0025BF740D|nr:acyl-CoA thioesterase domain-containing protein [Aeromicrobium sp.]
MTTAGPAQADLSQVLHVEQRDDDLWVGAVDVLALPQLFGGQLVGQSLMAAGRSVPEGCLPHSLHTTFLRGGRSGEPVSFRVERLRDGRSVSTREVSAWQDDRLLCRTVVSCTRIDSGLSHSRPTPRALGPEAAVDLRVLAEPDGGLGRFWDDFRAIEIRVEPEPAPGADRDAVAPGAAPPQNIWMRAVDPLGDDPLLHRAAVAYASDLMLMSTAVTPHGHTTGAETTLGRTWWAVSLDHTMWFHRDVRADEWLLFEHATSAAHDSRALIDAAVFGADGAQACRITQEALIRPLT